MDFKNSGNFLKELTLLRYFATLIFLLWVTYSVFPWVEVYLRIIMGR